MSAERKPDVFLAVPHYGEICPEAMPGLIMPTRKGVAIGTNLSGASLLAHNFNKLWCEALNGRKTRAWTHFAMHHSDIQSPDGWLDIMLEEMDRVGADVLSVIVPIKDLRGVTSTGWMDKDTKRIRRFTMHEIMKMPETFNNEMVGKGEHALMINTGLWICRFDQPWVEEFLSPAPFTIMDGIRKESNGDFLACVLSEDWFFSDQCHKKGLRVYATRKVGVGHIGFRPALRNDCSWGSWETDQGDICLTEQQAADADLTLPVNEQNQDVLANGQAEKKEPVFAGLEGLKPGWENEP